MKNYQKQVSLGGYYALESLLNAEERAVKDYNLALDCYKEFYKEAEIHPQEKEHFTAMAKKYEDNLPKLLKEVEKTRENLRGFMEKLSNI